MTEKLLLQHFADASVSAEASASDGTSTQNSQDGTVQTQNGEHSTDSQNKGDIQKEFEELIKGKYSSEFAKRTQSIIDKRFAKAKADESTLKKLAPLLEKLEKSYPDIEKGNVSELVNTFLNENKGTRQSGDNTVQKDDNEESGTLKLLSLRQSFAEKKEALERKKIIALWEKQSEEMKEIYPSFDFKQAVSDEDFVGLLKAGVSVRKAYEVSNLENILGSAMRYAAATAGRKTAQSILSSSRRVQENSVLDLASSVKHTDVNSLTSKEIMKILDQVKKGAKISF